MVREWPGGGGSVTSSPVAVAGFSGAMYGLRPVVALSRVVGGHRLGSDEVGPGGRPRIGDRARSGAVEGATSAAARVRVQARVQVSVPTVARRPSPRSSRSTSSLGPVVGEPTRWTSVPSLGGRMRLGRVATGEPAWRSCRHRSRGAWRHDDQTAATRTPATAAPATSSALRAGAARHSRRAHVDVVVVAARRRRTGRRRRRRCRAASPWMAARSGPARSRSLTRSAPACVVSQSASCHPTALSASDGCWPIAPTV